MATTLGVHVSWTGLPGDSAVQWSDVSSDVTAIDTQRGRSTELDQVQTGTASIQFDNADGAYTPGRAYGPELLPSHVRNTDDASQWTHGTHAALSINSGLNPPAGYLGSSTALQINMTSAVSGEDQATSAKIPVTPGKAYKGSLLAQSTTTAAGIVSARIAFYNSAGAEITSGVDHDYAYNQYPNVVRMSLPDTYHRMGAGETLTNQSNAVVGIDPMVCYNVTSVPSWDKYGTGTAASFNGTSSIAEPTGIHLYVAANTGSSVEFWFKTTTAGPILGDYNMTGSSWANPISPTGAPDLSSGKLWPALYVGTDGYLYCQVTSQIQTQVKSPQLVNDGYWHHYVVSVASYVASYYLDGVLIGTDSVSTTGGPGRPILGCADTTHNTTYHQGAGTPALTALPASNWFSGQIADFAQYRQGLSAQDVADHYRHGSTETKRIPINSGANLGWWFPVQAVGTAPTGAVKASLVLRTEQAVSSSSLYLYSPSLKEISPNYGNILPRRKVRVFETTGQNLMPPGLNLGYDTYDGVPAGMDVNEVGAWVLANGTNFSHDSSSGVTTYSATTSSVSSLSLYGPSGNGVAVPWMLIPGNTYTFNCQVASWRFAANSTGVTIGINTTVNSAPGSSTFFNGAVPVQHISPGDFGWKTVSWTFTIPSTYQQPEFQFTLYTSETLSSGSTYGWNTAIWDLQLVDVTKGQTVPAYTPGDGTMPVFQGFVDKWESLTEYDDTASVVATCTDPMRIMGDTQLPKPPQAFGFQPDWRVLGSWEMDGQADTNWVDPNQQMIGGSVQNANTVYNNMNYSPGFSSSALPGDFLGVGNNGVKWPMSPAIYLMSFGKLAAGMSIEFWYLMRQNTSDPNPGLHPGGDQYMSAFGPVLSFYTSGSSGYFSGGWLDRNGNSGTIASGAAKDMFQGGHCALELTTSGGSSPTVVTKCFYNGQLMFTSGAESLTMPPAPQFRLSGPAALTIGGVSINSATFELYAPASYAGTGLDWAGRLAAFNSARVSGVWNTSQVVNGPPAQKVLPWLMGACGLARPSAQLVTGSPSTSTASLVDPPSFSSATGLEGLNTAASQIGGLVCMSRYSAVMVQDSSYRSDSVVPYVFSALGSTAPDSSLLFLSDIDRTWTEVDATSGNVGIPTQTLTWNIANYPAYLRYGSHRQSMNIRAADLNETQRAAAFLASYVTPSTRCDSAQFTVINQDLASLVPMVDVGSRVVFTDLPANAPTDQYFAWVESVSVSAKAEGGTLVPTYTFSLSPDFAHLPIQ
jgi:hypothetical protein